MHRGYIKLWRKILDSPILHERGKRFSKLEAWIYLCLMANGTDKNGFKRGEFVASIRHLAKSWNWGKSAVERFISDLEHGSEPMIMRVGQQTGHFAGHFTICKYEIYNEQRDTLRDSKRDIPNKALNKAPTKTAKSEDLKSDPRFQPLKIFIFAKYREIRGCDLLAGGSDWNQVKNMLKQTNGHYTLEQIEAAWVAFLMSKDSFHRKQGNPVRWWACNLNPFLQQSKPKFSQTFLDKCAEDDRAVESQSQEGKRL